MEKLRAVIEVGANSVKFLAARKESGRVEILEDVVRVARLAEGMKDTGLISPGAMERNAALVAEFAARAREMGAEAVAVGAMGLRAALNAPQFIEKVRELTGLNLRVISGEEEARLSYRAAMSSLPGCGGRGAVFDTGGGSTEVIWGEGERLLRAVSLPVGAASVTEEFFSDDPVPASALEAAAGKLKMVLGRGGVTAAGGPVAGVGGAATTLASVKLGLKEYDAGAAGGTTLNLGELGEMAKLFASRTLEERKKIPGLAPDRAGIILAGTAIVTAVLKALEADAFTVSAKGLRHGLMEELLDG